VSNESEGSVSGEGSNLGKVVESSSKPEDTSMKGMNDDAVGYPHQFALEARVENFDSELGDEERGILYDPDNPEKIPVLRIYHNSKTVSNHRRVVRQASYSRATDSLIDVLHTLESAAHRLGQSIYGSMCMRLCIEHHYKGTISSFGIDPDNSLRQSTYIALDRTSKRVEYSMGNGIIHYLTFYNEDDADSFFNHAVPIITRKHDLEAVDYDPELVTVTRTLDAKGEVITAKEWDNGEQGVYLLTENCLPNSTYGQRLPDMNVANAAMALIVRQMHTVEYRHGEPMPELMEHLPAA
jgi:hypothetical protein